MVMQTLPSWATTFIRHTDLSSLPLGALRKAQHALYQTEVDSDSEFYEGSDQSNDSGGDTLDTSDKRDKAERSVKLKRDIPKRSNKHA
jgi:ribosomal RNA-processing protein 36